MSHGHAKTKNKKSILYIPSSLTASMWKWREQQNKRKTLSIFKFSLKKIKPNQFVHETNDSNLWNTTKQDYRATENEKVTSGGWRRVSDGGDDVKKVDATTWTNTGVICTLIMWSVIMMKLLFDES